MALKPSFKPLESLRQRRSDEGFTLIELMVVVLVIAILLAIAIPTFLGARERSQDRAAQSNLRNALTAAKVAYSNDGNYASATDTDLPSIEPRLAYEPDTTVSAAQETVSVAIRDCSNGVAGDTSVSLCTSTGTWSSASGTCGSATSKNNSGAMACGTAGHFAANSVWAGAVWSESETCWYIRDSAEAPASRWSGTNYGSDSAAANCTGAMAAIIDNASDDKW